MILMRLLRSPVARPLISIGAGLLVAAILMALSGYAPGPALSALGSGATGLAAGPTAGSSDLPLGAWHVSLFQLSQSLARCIPLLLCGLSVAIGLRAGLFNIGAQGQMIFGALASAVVGLRVVGPGTPPAVAVPLCLLSAALAGGAWAALPGALRALRGAHEVITTIVLNLVAANIADYLVGHHLQDPGSQAMQTAEIPTSSWLAPLAAHSNLTWGLFVALLAAAGVSFLIDRTAVGFEIRAVGQGPDAAAAAGIPVAAIRIAAMALSGALAGIAGGIEVLGAQHRYVDGIAGTSGFDGIAVALLAGLGGPAIAASALFFGALASGSSFMETMTSVPAPISTIVEGVVIAFAGLRFRQAASAPPVEEASR